MSTPTTYSIKKLLFISTIVLFSISALLGIISILFGSDETVWKIAGTTALLGMLSLLSMNNVFRLESELSSVRTLSTIALVSNILWSLPWILFLWDFFVATLCDRTPVTTEGYLHYSSTCSSLYYATTDVLHKIATTAAILSVVATVASNFLNIGYRTRTIDLFRYTAITSSTIIGLYFLPAIWSGEEEYIGRSWRFIAILAIIFVFSSIITPILTKVARTKSRNPATTTHQPVDEVALRRELEAKIRAEIAAEQRAESVETLK